MAIVINKEISTINNKISLISSFNTINSIKSSHNTINYIKNNDIFNDMAICMYVWPYVSIYQYINNQKYKKGGIYGYILCPYLDNNKQYSHILWL